MPSVTITCPHLSSLAITCAHPPSLTRITYAHHLHTYHDLNLPICHHLPTPVIAYPYLPSLTPTCHDLPSLITNLSPLIQTSHHLPHLPSYNSICHHLNPPAITCLHNHNMSTQTPTCHLKKKPTITNTNLT